MSTPMETNTANLREVLGAVNALPDVGALAVLYTSAQNLSNAQKEQARSNIGALSESELDNAIPDVSAYMPKSGGTFTGQVVAGSSNQAVGTSLLRNSKLVSSASYPSNNGEINWQYE